MNTRYIVGIDLGTTNSALAYVDNEAPEEGARIEVGGVPQLVNPGEVEDRSLLPSFLFIPGEMDFPKGQSEFALGSESAVRNRRAGAQTRRREPGAVDLLGQILALILRCQPRRRDPALAIAGRGPEALSR